MLETTAMALAAPAWTPCSATSVMRAGTFRRCAATVLPLAFTESMATRKASRRVWTCDSKSKKIKRLEQELDDDQKRRHGDLLMTLVSALMS